MASIQSLGVGSGLLTSKLLEDIVQSERAPVEQRLDSEKQLAETKISAWGEVKNAVSSFNSSLGALNRSSTFNASSVSSSLEEVVTASATSTAEVGSHSVEVNQLAQSHTLASQAYQTVDSEVGSGSLTFRFGTTTFDANGDYQSFTENSDTPAREVTIDPDNNTVSGIRDAVNSADIGVKATVVDDGSGFRLLFTNETSGEEQSMEITADGDVGLDALNFNAGSQSMEQTVAAQDASFSVDGLAITRSENSVSGVIPGVTLNLQGTGGPATVSVQKDTGEVTGKVQSFVDSYNNLKQVINVLTDFDPDAGENGQGSLLIGNSTLRMLEQDMGRLLRSTVEGLDGEIRSLSEVGIRTDQNNDFLLDFDSAKFSDALQKHPDSVKALFATAGEASDPGIDYVSASSQTRAGDYAVEVTQLATQGEYRGLEIASLADGNIVVDGSNDEFTLALNGQAAEITLKQDTYATAADLADQIQLQINSSQTFIDGGDSVTVNYDSANQRFTMTSNEYGSSSEIRFAELENGVTETMGFAFQGQGPYEGNKLASLATGVDDSTAAFNNPLVIDSNTQFSIAIDGGTATQITVPGTSAAPQTYNTPDELTTAIQTELDNAGVNVTAAWQHDADTGYGQLVFKGPDAGSELSMSDVSTAAQNKLGLFNGNAAPDVSTAGVDVAGTINGIEAEGTGRYLRAATGNVPAQPGYFLHQAHGDLSTATASDTFSLSVDGVDSGEITLGSFSNTDPEAVASAMQTAINNDPALIAGGAEVDVQYNSSLQAFGIVSRTTGTSSSVKVTDLQGNAGSILGFTTGLGDEGQTGTDATGEPDPAAGLRVRVSEGPLGERGEVSYIRGVARDLGERLDSYLGSEGMLTSRTEALEQNLKDIAEERQQLEDRMTRVEERLRASFLANDKIISDINSSGDFLSTQLEILESSFTGGSGNDKS